MDVQTEAAVRNHGQEAEQRCGSVTRCDPLDLTRCAVAVVTIRPTSADKRIANAIASHTTPALEQAAQVLTWGADEKVLLALAVGAWLYAARKPAVRPFANHLLAVSLLSSILPHLIKAGVNQTRPDRLTVRGHWRGVPVSGAPRDAFPSGHAVHMGAVASAAGHLPRSGRRLTRALAVMLSATRVLLLAHWTSDVLAGFLTGVLLERLIRPITMRRKQPPDAGAA
jgi:membrane-associated phospholipid phosphatase